MGTSPRLINIDPAHSRRPSKMVITKRRAELKYKPPDTRHPHPSQASVDHPGRSSTASMTWSQPSSPNCKAVATLKRSRQFRPYRPPSPEHLWTRGHSISTQSALLPTRPPSPLSRTERRWSHRCPPRHRVFTTFRVRTVHRVRVSVWRWAGLGHERAPHTPTHSQPRTVVAGSVVACNFNVVRRSPIIVEAGIYAADRLTCNDVSFRGTLSRTRARCVVLSYYV